MSRECMRDGCENERRGHAGSGGLFCSDDCRIAYDSPGTTFAESLRDALGSEE